MKFLKKRETIAKLAKIKKISFSSWLGRETYLGYYIDWFHQVAGVFPYCFILFIIASFYIGVYLYITGMVVDLHDTLKQLDQEKPNHLWPIYVNEFRFHNEILKYFYLFLTFLFISKIFRK